MFPRQSRRTSRSAGGRRGPSVAAWVESLEGRELLAYSPLGFSLPDLTVTGYASTSASWGGPVTVTADVSNIGASTLVEPLSLAPGSTSSADAPASLLTVYATTNPKSLRHAVAVGSIAVPAVAQNSFQQVNQTLTMPTQPPGFPGDGGTVYLVLVANSNGAVFQSDATNDVSAPIPVQIEAPLPDLVALGLDVPPVMQPGDTIQPNIRIANFGPADTSAQGSVTVALVASTTPYFTAGSSVVAIYTVGDIPGEGQVSSIGPVYNDANVTPLNNVVTITGAPVTLPASPAQYYIGVVIDPTGAIKQLQNLPSFTKPTNPFELATVVGPNTSGLPPAGVGTAGGVSNVPTFPFPYGDVLVGGAQDGSSFPTLFPPTFMTNTSATASSSPSSTGSGLVTLYSVSNESTGTTARSLRAARVAQAQTNRLARLEARLEVRSALASNLRPRA